MGGGGYQVTRILIHSILFYHIRSTISGERLRVLRCRQVDVSLRLAYEGDVLVFVGS